MAGRSDADVERAARGGVAAALQHQFDQRIAEKENQILRRAITDYRANTLTGDTARAAIAAIAELRSLMGDLDRDVRLGQEAQDRLMTGVANGR